MNQNISLAKYLLVCALGFGLGGALWGWVLYSELPDLEYPFHFIAIVIMGLFGGVSLVWFNKSVRNISKSVLAGLLGYCIGFIAVAVFAYPLYLYGGLFLAPLGYLVEIGVLKEFINLEPNIGIGSLWLLFFFIGIVVGLFYALFLKVKNWSLIWRGGIGFALGSLISPVIGNLLGNAFNSLLISYLTTFSLIGIILGLFLSWGVYLSLRGESKASDKTIM